MEMCNLRMKLNCDFPKHTCITPKWQTVKFEIDMNNYKFCKSPSCSHPGVRVCVCVCVGGFSCYGGQYVCADQNGSTFEVGVSIWEDFKSPRYPAEGSNYMNFHSLIGI